MPGGWRARQQSRDRRGQRFVAILLRIIDLFRGPIRAMGVEYPAFRALLETRLLLDARRAKDHGSPLGGNIFATLVVNLFFGIFAGVILVVVPDPVVAIGGACFITMFLLTMTLLVDANSLILDTTDIDLIAPLPVGDQTIVVSRIAHAMIYLTLVIGSVSIVPLVLGSFHFPTVRFLLAYGASMALIAIWCLAAAFGLFVLVIRLFDLERFRNVLLYSQIAAVVVLLGSYQIVPYLAERVDLVALFTDHPWTLVALPPFHYGGLAAVALGRFDAFNGALAAMALVIPLVILVVTVRIARTGFVSGLAAMASGERSLKAVPPRRDLLRDRLVRTPAARAGYDFFRALSRRERTFRFRVYPIVAFSIIFGVAFGLRATSDPSETRMICGVFYLLAMYSPAIILQARYSDDHEARWVLSHSGLDRPGEFVRGAMTSMVVTFVLPVLAVLLLLVLAFGGIEQIPDAIFASEVVLFLVLLSVRILGRRIPFTEKPVKNPVEGHLGTTLLLTTVVSAAIGLHVLARLHPVSFYGVMAVLAAASAGMLRRLDALEVPVRRA